METGGFELAAALAVTMAGIDQQIAERIVQGAPAICLYSNAIRSNVDVAIPRLGPVSPTDRFHNATRNGEQTCS
jgi:hypothetical protein